jgi:adenylosuccinate lyase
VVLPDASIALHYVLVKFEALVRGLVVDAERMTANLAATRGLVFSQAVLLALVDRGLSRDDAYRIVQAHAMTTWEGDQNMRDLLAADPAVGLDGEELESCFSLDRVGESARVVFERLADLKL